MRPVMITILMWAQIAVIGANGHTGRRKDERTEPLMEMLGRI